MHPKFALYLLGINYSISDEFIKQNKIDLTADTPPPEELLFMSMPLVMNDFKALTLTGIYLKTYGKKLVDPGKLPQAFETSPVKHAFLSSLLLKASLGSKFSKFINQATIIQDQDFNNLPEYRDLRWKTEKLPGHFKYEPHFLRFNLKVTEFEFGETRKLRTPYLEAWIKKV